MQGTHWLMGEKQDMLSKRNVIIPIVMLRSTVGLIMFAAVILVVATTGVVSISAMAISFWGWVDSSVANVAML